MTEEEKPKTKETADDKEKKRKMLGIEPVETQHELMLKSRTLKYKATAGVIPLKDEFDESLILGRNQENIKRNCPDHCICLFNFINNSIKNILIFFDPLDLLRNIFKFIFMIREFLLDEFSIMQGYAIISFGATV